MKLPKVITKNTLPIILICFLIPCLFTKSSEGKVNDLITKTSNGLYSLKKGLISISEFLTYLAENENIYVHVVDVIEPSEMILTDYNKKPVEVIIKSILKNYNYAIIYESSSKLENDTDIRDYQNVLAKDQLKPINKRKLKEPRNMKGVFTFENSATVFTETGQIMSRLLVDPSLVKNYPNRSQTYNAIVQNNDSDEENVAKIKNKIEYVERLISSSGTDEIKTYHQKELESLKEKLENQMYRWQFNN